MRMTQSPEERGLKIKQVDKPPRPTPQKPADKLTHQDEIAQSVRGSVDVVFSEPGSGNTLTVDDKELLPIPNAPEKTSIDGIAIEDIFRRFQADDPTVMELLSRALEDPADLEVIRNNAAALKNDFDLFSSIVLVGGYVVNISPSADLPVLYRLYGSYLLTEGGFGEVAEVYYIRPGSKAPEHGVIKIPKAKHYAEETFEFEIAMARRVQQVMKRNPEHPGSRALLQPIVGVAYGKKGPNFLIMPKVQSKFGKSETLAHILTVPGREEELFKDFGDAAMAYALLTQNDIIIVDGKPENIMCGPEGGIAIDYHSFVDKRDYTGSSDGKVQIFDPTKRGDGQHKVGKISSLTGIEHFVAVTPAYGDSYLIAEEVSGALPPDISAKLALGMSIAKFLTRKSYIDKEFMKQYEKTHPAKKSAVTPPPLLVPDAEQKIKRLYALFERLFLARYHPYEYKNNDPAMERDPQYISLEDTAMEFYRISYLFL